MTEIRPLQGAKCGHEPELRPVECGQTGLPELINVPWSTPALRPINPRDRFVFQFCRDLSYLPKSCGVPASLDERRNAKTVLSDLDCLIQ